MSISRSSIGGARTISIVVIGLVAGAVLLSPRNGEQDSLGDYLRASRKATGLTLRAVEAMTGVTNGYLSQIEGRSAKQPSPNVLYKLAGAYGIDYSDLLVRAGHRIPSAESSAGRPATLAGIPLRALEELTEQEAAELRNYLAYIRQKRVS